MAYEFNVDQFKSIIAKSKSVRDVLRSMNLKPYGGNYLIFKQRVKKYNIDISHFELSWKAMQSKRGKAPEMPLEKVLVENSGYSRQKLRGRILRGKLLQYKCSECDITEWNNRQISLHLDHINGVPDDNRLENLRFLCPNCHSQTPTYGSKRGFGHLKRQSIPEAGLAPTLPLQEELFKSSVTTVSTTRAKCKICSQILHRRLSMLCSKCYQQNQPTKIIWPTNLPDLVKNQSILSLSKILGVSNRAIVKRLKRHHP